MTDKTKTAEMKEAIAKKYGFLGWDSMLQQYAFGRSSEFVKAGGFDSILSDLMESFASERTKELESKVKGLFDLNNEIAMKLRNNEGYIHELESTVFNTSANLDLMESSLSESKKEVERYERLVTNLYHAHAINLPSDLEREVETLHLMTFNVSPATPKQECEHEWVRLPPFTDIVPARFICSKCGIDLK